MRLLILCLFLICSLISKAQNEYPEISNLIATVDNQTVTITYDLFDAENDEITISFLVSDNGGKSYSLNTLNATGDVGPSILPGNGKMITWDSDGLLSGQGEYHIKLVADDGYLIDIQEIVDQVDSTLLLKNLQFIEGIRHRIANPVHLENIKDSIEQRFIDANLETIRTDVPFNGYTGQNIIGRKEGSVESEITYILDGHFDSVDNSPGADDNGSAVAGLLEALRVLAPYNFKRTIKFISFDLEEAGLVGSLDYTANNLDAFETINGVLNLEMIGYFSNEPNSQTFPSGFEVLFPEVQAELIADQFRGNFITNVGYQNSISLQDAYNSAAAQYVPELKVISLTATEQWILLTPDLARSDHAPFWIRNIPALMLTDGSNFRNPNYHTANDLISTLDFTFMSNVVKAVVATIAQEAGIEHSTSKTTTFSIISNVQNNFECDINISPNPADDFLKFNFSDCQFSKLTIQLFDNMGRLVLQKNFQTMHQSYHLDLSTFDAGIYHLRLEDGRRQLNRKVQIMK